MTDAEDDDHRLPTAESRAAALARFAGQEAFLRELFAAPVVGNGVRGDTLLSAAGALPAGVAAGDRVTAKRAGWDEALSVDREADLEPYADKGYASDALAGELAVVAGGGLTVYLVGGQEADPATIRPADPEG